MEVKSQCFSWRHVYHDTLRSYRSAALGVRHTIIVQRTGVRHGKRPIRPPRDEIIRPALINETHGNPHHLSNAFTHALQVAETAIRT